MEYNQIKALLTKYFEGTSGLDEEKLLAGYFTSEKNIPDELKYAQEIFLGFQQETKIRYPFKEKKIRKILYLAIAGIAASLVLIAGILFYQNQEKKHPNEITRTNNTDDAVKIILDNGNIVWLNKNSRITYQNLSNPYINIVDISGEVYFEITNPKICRYQVLAQTSIIEVNAPVCFNVKITPVNNNMEITVRSGVVKVMDGGNENSMALLVTEGNYCSVNRTYNIAYTTANTNNNYLAWKTGRLVFTNETMATVSDILSEYYHVKIEFNDKKIAYCEFSGRFEKKPIDFVLESIKTKLNLDYKTFDNVIVLSGNNCF